MNITRLFHSICIAAAAFSVGCARHFISDGDLRREIHDEFETRRAMLSEGDLFTVFDGELSTEEREAMEFLYGAMSTTDAGDYDGEFFLDNVRMSLRARREMPWGRYIPEDLFRHFVLPVRVNNERLDEFRMIYYDTLRNRVAGMSLHDAALEVNHWCHEKATYTPSDSRTSSPLAVMRTAEGRCGEESTFTVAAMRAVGIPARQVYTPRWAHTDDNHAWVEVWVDGKWSFLGACEPEPELNVAWFNQPAARAMLMHTCVFGDYRGPEDVIRRTKCFTEINVVGNYAPVRRATGRIEDADGKAISGATVEFKIYNYGEFCTVVTMTSDDRGEVVLHTGLGDMMVWASHEGRFGVAKLDSESLAVRLDRKDGDAIEMVEDIPPPAEGEIPAHVSEEAAALNRVRLAREDSIRMAYTATFMTEDPTDSVYEPEVRRLLVAAKGNHSEVKEFIYGVPEADRARAVAMLRSLSQKDLRDTPCEVLSDALSSTPAAELTDEYVRYVLCPRIASEFLRPYRTAIREALAPEVGDAPAAADLIKWTRDNIDSADEYNPRRLQGTPAGVLRCRRADGVSRGIFFVAACRSFGLPARVDGMTGKVQYLADGEWIDVLLDGPVAERERRVGYMRMTYDKTADPSLTDPDYYRHFTLSKIEEGRCRLLSFDGGDATELGADASAGRFSRSFTLDEGYYMLTSGRRMASGKVLSRAVTFRIVEGETTDVELVMRRADDDVSVLGFMDAEKRYMPDGGEEEVSLLSTTGRGYFLVAVMGSGDEPTNHALRDLASMAGALKEWGRPVVVLSPSAEDAAKFDRKMMGDVAAHYGVDIDGKVRGMICDGCNSPQRTLPVVAVCDSFGRIVYFSQGYNTSLGEQLNSVIHKL